MLCATSLALTPRTSLVAKGSALLCIPLFATIHAHEQHHFKSSPLAHILTIEPQPCIATGTVVSEIESSVNDANQTKNTHNTTYTRFEIETQSINLGKETVPVFGRLLIVLYDQKEELQPGSRVTLAGRVKTYRCSSNPGEISRSKIYENRRIHGQLQCNHSNLVDIHFGQRPYQYRVEGYVRKYSQYGVETFFKYLKRSNAEFASALSLGRREFISDSTREKLLVTGTAHLLSVSGLHLGLIISSLHFVFAALRISYRKKLFAIVAFCLVYSVLTGLRPPVIRAAVMLCSWVIAMGIGRRNLNFNSLALCLLLFLIYDCFLLFELGVQLSFLAVSTIFFLNSHSKLSNSSSNQQSKTLASRHKQFQPSKFILRTLFALRLFATSLYFSCGFFLITTPFFWMHFNVIAPVSILTNVILSPVVLLALLLSLALPVCASIHESCGILLSMVLDFVLDINQYVIELAALFPMGHYWVPTPPVHAVILFYCLLPVGFWLRSKFRLRWIVYLLPSIWTVVYLPFNGNKQVDASKVEVTFLDVGHGTCVILRDNQYTWLYDCGSLGQAKRASRIVTNALWDMGVSRIEAIFLSHADSDHYNGLQQVIERFHVRRIYTTATTRDSSSLVLQRMFDKAESLGVHLSTVGSGDRIEMLGGSTQVLHPPRQKIYDSDNSASLVLEVVVFGHSLVLPGDIDGDGVSDLITKTPPGRYGFVMAPHHGSLTPETERFIEWSNPSFCIISGLRRSMAGSIETVLRQRGLIAYATYQHQAIRISWSIDEVQEIQHWDGQSWNHL
ncbi:MAG: ComEC/Rec2 family competence protein [Rubripirellula sp.]|nr:ComEC/Rec2 family competence protein [Rubripirellula sp.]